MPALQLVIEIDDKGAISKVKTLDGEFKKFTGGMGAKAAIAASAMKRISDSTRMLQDGFKKAALAATAFFGIDAVIGVVRKGVVGLTKDLLGLFRQGAEINDMKDTFARVRDQAGLLPGTLQEIRNATRGTVDDMKLMAVSARALADELDPSLLIDFWAKARQISEANGTPVAQVFEMLYLAVAKGQTRMLTGIGITLDADAAMESYALMIGKTTAQLNFQERQLAVTIALEEKYNRQFKSLGELGADAAEKFNRVSAGVTNLKNKFLGMLADSPSVEKFLGMLIEKIDALSASMDTWEPKIKAVVDRLSEFYTGIVNFASDKLEPALAWLGKYKEELLGVAAALVTISGLGQLGVPLPFAAGIGAAVGLGTFVGAEAKGWEAELARMNAEIANKGIPNFNALREEAKQAGIDVDRYTNEALRELLTSMAALKAMVPTGGIQLVVEPPTAGKAQTSGGGAVAAVAAVVAPQAIDWAAMGQQAEAAAQGTADMHLALSASVSNQLKADYLDTVASTTAADESWFEAKLRLAEMERDSIIGNAAEMAAARIACDAAVKDAELEHNEAVWQAWQAKHSAILGMMQGLEAGYDTLVDSALDAEMSGKQRREAVWMAMKQSFLRISASMLKEWLLQQVKHLVIQNAAQFSQYATEKLLTAHLAAAKAYSAYMGIPFVGPVLGAAAAGQAFAATMAFHKGGFIEKDERIVKVQTEEFVMQRSAVRDIGRPAMEYMNATGRIPAGGLVASGRVSPSGGGAQIGPFVFQISASDKDTANGIVEFIEEKVVPMLEGAILRGKFSLEGEM